MKKIALASILAITTFAASAASYVSVDVENVRGLEGASNSTAQYIRAGTELGGIQYGLQGRTAKLDGGGLLSSVEVTAAKNSFNLKGITPFVGVGHDNGFNGGASYNYGLVGATYGLPVGPGFLLTGIKTRVGSTEAVNTKQTVGFATYSIPVAKNVAFNLNASRSGQDIKEEAFGVGLSFGF
jgi:hypothetical protein